MYVKEPGIPEPVPTDLPYGREPTTADPPNYCREIYEVEDATYDSELAKKRTSLIGYSGSGYIDTKNEIDTYLEFEVTKIKFEQVNIIIYYSNASSTTWNTTITLDGVLLDNSFDFPSQSSWDIWARTSFTCSIGSGMHTLRLTANTDEGLPNIDYLAMTYPVDPDSPGEVWFELDNITTDPQTPFLTGIHLDSGSTGLYHFDIIIDYNPGMLELIEPILAGPESPSPYTDRLGPGRIRIYDYNSAYPAGEDLHILDINWQAIQPGTTEVVITPTEIEDSSFNKIGYPRGRTLDVTVPWGN
jgi:hypothetical protein